ncbi:tetratricopeptide repeat protein, partial [Aquifex sp.]
MWKHIKLFSLFFLLVLITFGEELKENLTVKVKVREIIELKKPEFQPPDKLSYRVKSYDIVNVQGKLLEPPKEMEEAELYVPKEGGCGAPKDLNLYKQGVEAYLKGDLYTAEKALTDLLAIPSSPFANPAKYLLGLVKYKKVKYTQALKLFEEACNTQHLYTAPACESFFALYFKLYDKAYPAKAPELWRVVYTIHEENFIPDYTLECERYTFKKYCSYVNDFIQGKVNLEYRASTEIRKALLLFEEGKYEQAKKILERYKSKLLPYRDVVIYYLGLIALKEGNYDEAVGYALLLETLNEELAKNLYVQIALERADISEYAYEKTKDRWILRFSGIKAYNEGDYKKALRFFEQAGEYIYAAYAALKLGNYELAYELLKKSEKKNELYYQLLLEIL